MRCDECKTEPVTPGHYCECCGRKLSLQERKALDDQRAAEANVANASAKVDARPAETSWGEPAPVRRKAPQGDRLVGVHFAPEPEPYVDVEPVPEPFVDPVLEAHFDAHAAFTTATALPSAPALPSVPPAPPVASHRAIDPMLEAHFAGQAPVGAEPPAPLAGSVSVAPILDPHSVSVALLPEPRAVAAQDIASLAIDAPLVDVPAAHLDRDAPGARCESCGGPAEDGDLCSACQHAFHSLLDNTVPAPPRAEAPAHVPQAHVPDVPVHDVPVHDVEVHVHNVPVHDVEVHVHNVPVHDVEAQTLVAVTPAATVPAPAVQVSATPVAIMQPVPAPPKIGIKPRIDVKDVAVEQPAPSPAEPAQEPVPARARSPKPAAPVQAASVPPAAQPSRVRTIGAAAAVVVVVAAIGFPLGKLWLGGQDSSPIVREDPRPAARPVPEAEPAVAVAPPAVVAAAPASAPAGVVAPPSAPAPKVESPSLHLQKVAAVTPLPAKAAAAATTRTTAARVPPKGKQPVTQLRAATAVVAPSPVPVAPAPEVAAPAPVAAPEPKAEPPAAPVGPFFELREVNETPRVASRVEPQVPDDLRDRQLNEVVIVRVLVTQAGRPLMVNLLRRSKAGPSLDNAIVAAVKQWTFVPAKKRGEAVSCWYHVGVPVSQAN